MRPVFADPKTDFVFKRLFGEEAHKSLLISLLNALLELPEGHRIENVQFLTQEQRPAVPELKLSIVDVKCFDEKGNRFVVEMQVLNVEGFEKRIVYNVSKAYVMQLRTAEQYPGLNDVIGVTICDFPVWPWKGSEPQPGDVPMLSRWRMQEQHSGVTGLPQMQFVFLELPKYRAEDQPETIVEKWAYFFREAENLTIIPPVLNEGPFPDALHVAETSRFTPEDWDYYDRVKMAEQDARGAVSLAERTGERRGRAEGKAEGLRIAIYALCEVLEIPLDSRRRHLIESSGEGWLEEWLSLLSKNRTWV